MGSVKSTQELKNKPQNVFGFFMKTFSLFVLMFLIGLSSAQAGMKQSYVALKNKIEQKYGIEIRFDNIKLSTKKKHHYTPVPLSARLDTLNSLWVDLSLYPESVVKFNLKVINIFDELFINDDAYGGTVNIKKKQVFVHYKNVGSVNIYRSVFHHEFSSILLYSFYFNDQAWVNVSHEIAPYKFDGTNSSDIIKFGDPDFEGGPDYFNKGFICGYGSNDYINDFNTFFEVYIANPQRLKNLANEYPLIKKKYDLLVAYFERIKIESEQKLQASLSLNQ